VIQRLTTESNNTRHAVYYLLAHFWVLPSGVSEIYPLVLGGMRNSLDRGDVSGRKAAFRGKSGPDRFFPDGCLGSLIQHSQEARFYSLFVLLTLASLYAYVRALKTNRPWAWVVNALTNILLFYTHTSAVFLIAAEYLHYFIYWKQYKKTFAKWICAQLLLLLAMIPAPFFCWEAETGRGFYRLAGVDYQALHQGFNKHDLWLSLPSELSS
jgi:hypothetical protein